MGKSENHINRRGFLAGVGGLAAGMSFLLPDLVFANQKGELTPRKAHKHVLRFCHLTDMHIFGDRNAAKGLAQMLEHINRLDPKPSLLVTGGDNIMDAYETEEANVAGQFTLLKKTIAANTNLPIRYCLGNHDIWGWHKANSKTTGDELLWGTQWALAQYGMPAEYYSFDQAGWRFIILNSIQHHPEDKNGYIGGLGDTQFAWLEKLLADTPENMPVIIISHISILSVCNFEDAKTEDNEFRIPQRGVCADAPKLLSLFKRHPNVKLCFSGHLHRFDHIEYMNVNYICDGAVSGAWWQGDYKGCHEGYGIVDLYSDGTFDHRYAAYGWKV